MSLINATDNLSLAVNDFWDSLSKKEQATWEGLILHLLKTPSSAKASKKWISTSETFIKELSEDKLIKVFINWMDIVKNELRAIVKAQDPEFVFLSLTAQSFLKGMVWICGLIDANSLSKELEELGLLAYKKIRWHGAVSAKLGNTCLYAFSLLPFEKSIGYFLRYRHKVNYAAAKKIIERRIAEVAQKVGKSPDEIEEMAIEDYGLDNNHQVQENFGLYAGIATFSTVGNPTIIWQKPDKNLQKTVPSYIKENYNAELKAFKNKIKTIESSIPVHKGRIEQSYLAQRVWRFAEWDKYYIQHTLVSIVAKRLIWRFSQADEQAIGIFKNDQFVDVNNEIIDWLTDDTAVELWHPVHSTSDEVFAWRNYIEQHKIQQPFKQAYREIYLLTDAERNTVGYSNRFAAHVLKQHQFATLCKIRGWKYTMQGDWGVQSIPTLQLPHWNMAAEFWTETNYNSETRNSGIYNYIFSDQVRFYFQEQLLHIEDVPQMVFTEVMRDVDLFVGVTSIGNDPTWMDGNTNTQYNDYWENYAFGELSESAKTRKAALEKLVPRLKIASKCSFDGKFLIVEGQLRSYKIHLGSGNILMSPNDQYLCIVPDAKSKHDKVFLPFEGDRMLSIILSKAFMLVNDTAITDSTITSQISA